MKILHAPFCFHPDPMGGTEVYVQNLAVAQSRRGAEVVIAAAGARAQQYRVRELEVYRFPGAAAVDLREFYGEGDPGAAEAFGRILEAACPDLVHLHAFTSGVSLRVARAAKRAGLPVVFTYHTPTVSCQRGTLLRWGTELCHGHLDVRTCTACSLESLGLRRGAAGMASRIPPAAGRALGKAGLSGGLWTALRMTDLVALRHEAFRNLMEEVDQVVSLCSWTTDLLVANGVRREKIRVCRHGLPAGELPAVPPEHFRNSKVYSLEAPCRIAFLGRITPVKGLDILIRAMAADPDLPVVLDIYGVVQDTDAYRSQLEKQCDARIRFHPALAPDEVIARLRDYDVLAVPSQWLETGPLVVLEAFAAGIPVIGSDLGGIRELVRQGVDGLLVEPRSVSGWTAALRRLCREPDLLRKLREGVRPPRTMEAVAADMLSLYEQLVSPARQAGRAEALASQ
jgi:glycosyltransferase involved in cell wall biosynthesis